MSLSIKQASVRKDGHIQMIELSAMTDAIYQEVEEHLYCPNLECNARIEFASGKKLTYFRTKRSVVMNEEIIEQHIENCPYFVEHDKELAKRKKYDPNLYVGISDKHLNDALSRAYKKHVDPDYGKKTNIGGNNTKSKSHQSKDDDGATIRGKASLLVPVDENQENKKEPALFQKNINEITDVDYNTVKTVSGEMLDFVIKDNYKYITLKMVNGKKGRIFFGEYFKEHNDVQYEQIDNYKKYIDYQKKIGKDVFVACVGEIIKDDFDISVVMNKYKGIQIDNKKHYQILSYLEAINNR